jgi:hypothetical protein
MAAGPLVVRNRQFVYNITVAAQKRLAEISFFRLGCRPSLYSGNDEVRVMEAVCV